MECALGTPQIVSSSFHLQCGVCEGCGGGRGNLPNCLQRIYAKINLSETLEDFCIIFLLEKLFSEVFPFLGYLYCKPREFCIAQPLR